LKEYGIILFISIPDLTLIFVVLFEIFFGGSALLCKVSLQHYNPPPHHSINLEDFELQNFVMDLCFLKASKWLAIRTDV
jgi:hypothetical protein